MVEYISLDMLLEETVVVSYQILGLCPAMLDNDLGVKHDWRTYSMQEKSFSVLGKLIQPLDLALLATHITMPFYLLESTVIVVLMASIFQSLTISDLNWRKLQNLQWQMIIPTEQLLVSNLLLQFNTCLTMINYQHYRCLVCETDEGLSDIGIQKMLECPCCSPTVILDLTHSLMHTWAPGCTHSLWPWGDSYKWYPLWLVLPSHTSLSIFPHKRKGC